MKAGWQTSKLGELLKIQNGYAFSSKDYSESGSFLMRIGNVQNGYVSLSDPKFVEISPASSLQRFVLSEGDILVSLTGNVGRVGVIQEDHLPAVLNQRVARISISKNSPATRDYLLLFLYSDLFREELMEAGHGAAQQNISTKDIVEIQLPVPPLAEQQRIVAILDTVFDGIATAKATAEQNLQNARALFESHLQSVFTQRGEGWIDRQLASLCHEITVGHVGSMKTEYKASGIPFLRSQNIRPFEVSMDNVMFIDAKFHHALKKSRLRPGDLAIVRTGYPGTAAVIPPELPDSNCSDLVIVRPGDEVNPHFLAAFFNSAFGKQLVLGKIVGAAQKHFNVTAAKEVMLHVPPINEQKNIIQMIDSFRAETQRLESLYQRKLAALDELKQSLLHQAFSGAL